MLKGDVMAFCQASETEAIQIVNDDEKTFEVKKTTYAVATF